jgi:SAM-dependent methyltransferase
MLARWERAAVGWGKRAQSVRDRGMPVSVWMIEQLRLQPGQSVLELAAGPGDTGFMAAETVQPGGMLLSSDAVEAMLEVARGRARELGVDNVEFKQLELEWIDLPTASVDAVLCRWGLMLTVDPAAALQECRRVLRPGGRAAFAVWDEAAKNPWTTTASRVLIELGHSSPPEPGEPGMFALADAARWHEMLEDAGFVDVVVQPIDAPRTYPTVEEYLAETLDLSRIFAEVYERLSPDEQTEVRLRIEAACKPFTEVDGTVRFPATALGAAGGA